MKKRADLADDGNWLKYAKMENQPVDDSLIVRDNFELVTRTGPRLAEVNLNPRCTQIDMNNDKLVMEFRQRWEDDQKRWGRIMPLTEDTVLMILKGHLLIEEQFQGIINEWVNNPSALEDARLTFIQKLRLSNAIGGYLSRPVIWETAREVNSIRNHLAHQAEPKNIKEKLESLFAQCCLNDRYLPVKEATSLSARLYLTLGITWASLSGVRDSVGIIHANVWPSKRVSRSSQK